MKSLFIELFLAAVIPLTTASGCTSGSRSRGPSPGAAITRVLDRQAEAWNQGDIEGFMEGYWRSPQLTFSGKGKVTRGFEPTLQHFRTSYPDKAAMGHLTFSDLEITPLARDAALVLGRWRVESKTPTSGAFSLTMRRIEGRWLIVHDHTSRDAS